MEILTLILLTLIFITAIRIGLVCGHVLKAIDLVHEKQIKDINNGIYPGDKRYRDLNAVANYNKMLFDISKWTFKQFYPDL